MDRRTFLSAMLKAGVACAALPAAATYARNWAGLLVPRGTVEQPWFVVANETRGGWVKSVIRAHYTFDANGKAHIKVEDENGHEFGSILDAARYIAKTQKTPDGQMKFDVIETMADQGCIVGTGIFSAQYIGAVDAVEGTLMIT